MTTATDTKAMTGMHLGRKDPHSARCRFCSAPLRHTFVDLGMSPLCESYLTAEQLNGMEPFYPLHVHVCQKCFLVQLEEYVGSEAIFSEYAYFSSYSDTWLAHARSYVEAMMGRFALGPDSQVVEVASNDGYLLQYFVAQGVPVLGIEPAGNVAQVAIEKGVPTRTLFFGTQTAHKLVAEGIRADLVIGNNVLAQVPDLNDFVEGLRIILKPHGVVTIEFPHLARLMEDNQLDTIYHEHFSYFSFLTAERIFAAHDLTLFDVEELPTHGGSLRIYARHANDDSHPVTERLTKLKDGEKQAGFTRIAHYEGFAAKAVHVKHRLLELLIGLKRQGRSIAGYGAPGKGNTLLNYCGIRTDLLEFTVDRSPYKQGKFLPGTHIPILNPEVIAQSRPDYLLVLPWNLKDEIVRQMSFIREWNGRFIVPIPEPTILP